MSEIRPNLVLLGFMGVGKSTVGRGVARRLGLRFVDMDREIERKAGARIPEIFATRGESAFRALESEVAAELGGRDGLVIAAGGGVILRQENLDALSARGAVVVGLTGDPEVMWERVRRSTHRPLLQGPDPRARFMALHAEREPLYQALRHRIEATSRPTAEVVEAVAALYPYT